MHIRIVETDHTVPVHFQILSARLIVGFSIRVCITVKLDYQLVGRATEVRDKCSDRVLTSELQAGNLVFRRRDQSFASAGLCGCRKARARPRVCLSMR